MLFLWLLCCIFALFIVNIVRFDRLVVPMNSVPCDCLGGEDCFSESVAIPTAEGKACAGQVTQITVRKLTCKTL
jgi:hypothetical protein